MLISTEQAPWSNVFIGNVQGNTSEPPVHEIRQPIAIVPTLAYELERCLAGASLAQDSGANWGGRWRGLLARAWRRHWP